MDNNSRDRFSDILKNAALSFADMHCKAHEATREIKVPLSDWETILFCRGIDNGLIDVSGHNFQVCSRTVPYNFFGFNREYIVQIAAYVLLITDYEYPKNSCDVEYHLMDVVVFRDKQAYIYCEAKNTKKDADSLLKEMTKYSENVPMDAEDRGNDPLRKAKYLIKDKPKYFWLISAESRQAFSVEHGKYSFKLIPADDIPKYNQL
jgi:hypothetical protein